MRSRTDSIQALKAAINPHVYPIVGLFLTLVVIIFKVPPTSLFVVFFVCFLTSLVLYLVFLLFIARKTSLFISLAVSIGLFLYLISAFSGLNTIIYGALVIALGIYLYR